ncbi:hypothetical protein [Caballeronia sp. GAWG1-1]|uniref:DUF7946 domain-containing protein n=1 Tax=Caballeronia sp. GAWG1-1 TaxID=2921742 RepID=UPI0020299402|nr:hypothetical protein [Caballeronia sp. GAWG1-1]
MSTDSTVFITVRYEGNEAEQHEIELHQLGQSIQGFARIFAICANVLRTGKIARHLDSLEVRVMAVPVAEHNCFEVLAMIKTLATSKDLWSGAFGALLAAVVQYVLSRKARNGDEDLMEFLKDTLQQALHNNQLESQRFAMTIEKMMVTIEKLAESLRPAARQALSPIGRSCNRIDLYAGDCAFVTLDSGHKQAFADAEAVLSDHLATYDGLISEFDMATGACKVTLEGEPSRIPAIVTDPIFNRPNNPYVEAMACAISLRFLAKADLDADGNPSKLYISDTAEQSRSAAGPHLKPQSN